MDGKLFLSTAKELLDKGTQEADFRSAISRSYYACFLEARKIIFQNCQRNILNSYRIRKEINIRHADVQNGLNDGPSEPIKQLGQELQNLKGNREDADYNMDIAITRKDAEDALENAKFILDEYNQIGAPEIGRTVEGYFRKVSGQ